MPVTTVGCQDRGGWRVRQDHAVGTLRRLAALLAQVPTVACTGRCATRACRDLTVSALDIAHVRHATGHTLTTHGDHACSLLDDSGTCQAHEQRPLVCRLYGVHEYLACPFGCQPEQWLDTATAVELLTAIERLDPRAATYLRIGAEPDPAITLDIVRHYLTNDQMPSPTTRTGRPYPLPADPTPPLHLGDYVRLHVGG